MVSSTVTTALPPLSQAVGYGVIVGIGGLFAVGMIGLTRALKKYLREDPGKAETFMVADRNVGVGLTASAVVSSWAWTTAMLSSATVTFNFGVSGAFWFAAGCVVQISFFAFLAIHSKLKTPRAHTLLEIIRTRYGKTAHIVYMGLCLIDNIISVANMLLGASAVVSALSGISVTAANFLLPFGVVAYTVTGGLKATFLTDWIHTVVILIIILYFGFLAFSTDLITSPAHLFELVNAVSAKVPVAQNKDGSYFTMASRGGIEFGIIHTLGNFGLVIADTSFWQKGFAADTTAAVPGYILGGVAYFCIPFSLGTIMGLAGVALQSHPSFPTYPNPMSAADINNGLVVPFVAQTLGGKGAAGAALALVFMAVTSTTSAQLIAVSSISAFDVYKTWINPGATDHAVVRVSHAAVIGFGVFMAAFSTAIFYGGASLGWTIYMLGVIVCPASFPILLTLLWDRQTKLAAIVSPIVGMAAGIAVWLGTAYHYSGVVNVASTGASLPCVYGTVTSAFTPLPVSVIISLLFRPQRYDWADLNKIDEGQAQLADELKDEAQPTDTGSNVSVSDRAAMHRGTIISGTFSLFLFLSVWVLWPLPMYGSGYIFSPKFFTGWIRVGQIWTFFALGIAGVLPLWQGRHSIVKVFRGVFGLRQDGRTDTLVGDGREKDASQETSLAGSQ